MRKSTRSQSKQHKNPGFTSPKTGPIALNRKASFEYSILDTVEAGIVLTGTEIKAIRQGKVDLRDSFARAYRNEIWLNNLHISPYLQGNVYNHEPKRTRKLLLHREQIDDLSRQSLQRGFTLVPLRLYITGRVAKVLLGLGRGKRQYQKKEILLKRAVERDIDREMKFR